MALTQQLVVLVAEDEPAVRNLVTALMQMEGYLVLSAADGLEGLELSRQFPGQIHLLITDVSMPRMNGVALTAHLLADRPGIKVLMMSGENMTEVASQNTHLHVLLKPFDGQTLTTRAQSMLAHLKEGQTHESQQERA